MLGNSRWLVEQITRKIVILAGYHINVDKYLLSGLLSVQNFISKFLIKSAVRFIR